MPQQACEIQLLNQLKGGCTAAFDEIYCRYSKPLYIYLLQKLKNPEVCNDILQDLFINLWEKKSTLNIQTSLKAYLYQSARFKIIDIYRNHTHFKAYAEDLGKYIEHHYPDALDKLHYQQQLREVIAGIHQLPLKMKEVFIASRFEYLTINQISVKLKISPQTVKNQLSKALHILRLHHYYSWIVLIGYLIFR
ncbi:RNA polymerase sigma factor [Mucilaginibacter sp.]